MSDSKGLAITLPLLTLAVLASAYFALDGQKKSKRIGELEKKLVQYQTGNPSEMSGTANASYEKRHITITRKPQFSVTNVTCSLCSGEGALDYNKPKGGDKTYGCPVCKTAGTLTLKVPTGQEICVRCDGLGKTSVPPKPGVRDIYNAKLCTKCNGSGWRKIRKKKTS